MRVSGRNQLPGIIESVEEGAVTSIVTIRLQGGDLVVASITRQSQQSLELHVGQAAFAVIKASDVMVGVD